MAAPDFSKQFVSTSIGVECELGGFVCVVPANFSRCFAWVKLVDPSGKEKDQPLVQLTKDMSLGAYGNPKKRKDVTPADNWKVHTLELVTYPCAKSDHAAIENRNKAVQFLLAHFRSRLGTHNHEPLENTFIDPEKTRFALVVENSKHLIAAGDGTSGDGDPMVTMSTSGQQATMGVRASDFGTGINNDLRLLEKSPWFKVAFEADFETRIKSEGAQQTQTAFKSDDLAKAKRVYAYLCSIIEFTAKLADKYHIELNGYAWRQDQPPLTAGLTDPRVKNEWEVLPRTMPRMMLDILPDAVASMTNRFVTAAFPDTNPQNLKAAVRHYIQEKGEVVGHHINDARVDNEQALLFEFRTIPNELADFVPKQVTSTVVVEDVLAEFGKNRAAVLPVLETFVGGRKSAFRTWFVGKYKRWEDKKEDYIFQTATASQKATWIKETMPEEWGKLLKIEAAAGPQLPPIPARPPGTKTS